MEKQFEWQPLKHLVTAQANAALIILNQPIRNAIDDKLDVLWRHSSLKLCVDGGTNRVFEWCERRGVDASGYLPDVICGDLDSIEPHIMEFYTRHGVRFLRLSNQNLSDFSKTLRLAVNCIGRGQYDEELFSSPDEQLMLRKAVNLVYCVGEFAGRVDHALGNLHSLYESCLADLPVYLISPDSLTFLLKSGANSIKFDSKDELDLVGRFCGLFPLGQSARVTTHGLKWNITPDRELSFPSFISSSNEFDHSNGNSSNLSVDTDRPILFTMSIN